MHLQVLANPSACRFACLLEYPIACAFKCLHIEVLANPRPGAFEAKWLHIQARARSTACSPSAGISQCIHIAGSNAYTFKCLHIQALTHPNAGTLKVLAQPSPSACIFKRLAHASACTSKCCQFPVLAHASACTSK